MTIGVNDRLSGPYTAVAGQTAFAFDFPISAGSQVSVIRRRGGIETALAYGADYTVTITPAGGAITLQVPALAGDGYVIFGARAIVRTTQFPGWRTLLPTAVEAELDYATTLDQEQRRDIGRALAKSFFGAEWNFQGGKAVNLGDGTAATDGATFGQLGAEILARQAADVALNARIAAGALGDSLTAQQIYASRTAVTLAEIDAGIAVIRTNAYALPGDGGGALLIRKTPALALYVTDAAGGQWSLDPSQELHVAMFGAVGDGVANDTPAIQAALDYVAGGGTLRFAHKIYGIGGAGIAANMHDGVRILGDGATLKALALPTQEMPPSSFKKTLFKLSQCSRVTVCGFNVDGSGYAANAIGLVGCTQCRIEDNELFNGGWQALLCSVGGSANEFRGNVARDSVPPARGVWIGNVNAGEFEADFVIADNVSKDNGASAYTCVGSGRITGNYGANCQGSGLALSGSDDQSSADLLVSGNVFTGNAFHGIQADIIAAAARLRRVAITANRCVGNAYAGIYLYNFQNALVAANECANNGLAGISINGAGDVLNCTGNLCHDTRTGGARTQDNGISLVAQNGDVRHVNIAANVCDNNTAIGIQVVNSGAAKIENIAISGNHCRGNSSYGIFAAEAAAGDVLRLLIDGNLCAANDTDLRTYNRDVTFGANVFASSLGIDQYDFANGDTTPSVAGRRHWRANNSGATTITAFDDGPDGHEIVIRAQNANTTIQHGGNLVTKGSVTVNLPGDGVICFRRLATVWIEQWRSF